MNTKQLLLLIIILFSIKIYSQKCKVEKDPFTDEQVVSFDFDAHSVYFELKNEKILFEIIFNYWGERDFEFKENTEVLFKLEDGTKLALKTTNTAQPKLEKVTTSNNNLLSPGFGSGMTVNRSENFTAYSFVFNLSKDQLRKFADSQIEIIRIPDTDEGRFIDLEPKNRTKKKIKALNKGASCLAEHI